MSRKPQQKIDQVADTTQTNTLLAKAALFIVGQDNKIKVSPYGKFLLNPSSYDESLSSNWNMHNIPGQSDPIMNWVSGGPRIITFEALVTKDNSTYDIVNPPSPTDQLIDSAVNAIGNIASAFAGVNLPPLGDLLPIGDQGEGEDLGIQDYLNYYRSLRYPLTSPDKTQLLGSPPLVALFAGKTFSSELTIDTVSLDTDLWVVTDVRIKITKQLPNLCPMEAVVTFQLIQYVRRSKSRSDFAQNEPSPLPDTGSILDSITGLF